ncbi:Centrosomal protein of 70 kDa [Bagarius yarrelli]|uniref:Centrosomal protein of 70 kDa n=1 Tax=Bagarius yarrelli TaxID=175774 RepID=A0A556VVX5_BAGYA|nr:Centrosomal protein of 70 kDa [Bagarius yarrelli]
MLTDRDKTALIQELLQSTQLNNTSLFQAEVEQQQARQCVSHTEQGVRRLLTGVRSSSSTGGLLIISSTAARKTTAAAAGHKMPRSTQSETSKNPVSSSADTQRHDDEYQRYILEICSELRVQDVGHLVAAVKMRCREADSALRLEKILGDFRTVLTNPRAPLAFLRKPDTAAGLELEEMVPMLELWSQQLSTLPELQRSVSRLVRRLLPCQPEDGACPESDCVKIEDVMLMVDMLLDETTPDDKMLFDVPSLHGVYPRMNEVYTRLAEMNNAMRNLRDILQLNVSSGCTGRVCRDVTDGQARPYLWWR